jgi:2-polyprenyl-6-methoxyphenol hydroxylase-like FAD-dependent oxidoreductase
VFARNFSFEFNCLATQNRGTGSFMVRLKRVEIIGAGPAGLYTAILLKSRMPGTEVRVTERNSADTTFGFGVVFSDQALDFLQADDAETHALITPSMQRWRNMTLSLDGERVVLDGIGFAAIGRLSLLRVLQRPDKLML